MAHARELVARLRAQASQMSAMALALDEAICLNDNGESRPLTPQRPVLVVGQGARWVIPAHAPMTRIDLVRSGARRRLLDRLVTARLHERGVAISAEGLIEAGWPGERMLFSAGLVRVYSAVRRLRRRHQYGPAGWP